MNMPFGLKIHCELIWTSKGWSRKITMEDNPINDRSLIIVLNTSEYHDYSRFYDQFAPISDSVKYMGVPVEHILVTIMTKRFTSLRPYVSLMNDVFHISPDRVHFGDKDVSIENFALIFSDSRRSINFF